MTLTQDNRTTSTMTADNRTAVGTLTQDSRQRLQLWASATYPWTLNYPWKWLNSGQVITQDLRT